MTESRKMHLLDANNLQELGTQHHNYRITIQKFNGLQVNRGEDVFDRDEFTKSLIFRDFDYALKNPFRNVHLFPLHTLLSKKIPKIAMEDL